MLWIVLIVILLLVVGGVLLYNGLVGARIRVDNAWADVDVQLKRRYELIPNLVETVKGYAGHERETLEAVIAARNQAVQAQGPEQQARAENMLTGALRQLFALSEAYPELRAVESFTRLQQSLEEIEDAIQNARRYYNAVVRDYNTRIQQIPGSLIAGPLGFQSRPFFGLEDEAQREAPRVDFGGDG
jgi:LemA protein